jgi:WD40 repeat protein
MEYSRDGRYFATTTTGWLRDSTEISIWETKNWQLLFSQWLKNEGMTSLQFSPDGNFLLAHTYWQNLYIWNLKEKKLIQNPIGIVEGITGMEFSSDGKYLIGNYIDNITRIWDFSTGMLVNSIKHSQKINSSVLSPDERFFLTSSDDGILRLYDPITGNMVCETDNSSSKPIHDISFDPDGKWVLAVNEDDSIQLFDFGFLYEGNVKQLCIIAQILNNNMVNDNLIMQTPTNKLINEYKKLKQSCSLNAKLDPVVKWLLSSPLERPISPFSK